MTSYEQSASAYHEAGHVLVAASAASVGVRSVRIGTCGGSTRLDLGRIEGLRKGEAVPQAFLYEAVKVADAGRLAEEIRFGQATGHAADRRAVLELLFADALRQLALAAAERTGDYYAAESKIAEKQALRLWERAKAAAELELRLRWGAVENLARWLLRCGSLGPEHVRTAIDTAEPNPRGELDQLARLADRVQGDPVAAAFRAVLEAEAGLPAPRKPVSGPRKPARRQSRPRGTRPGTRSGVHGGHIVA